MDTTSLSNNLERVDVIKTAHESLYAKINQARAISNMAVSGDPTQLDLFHIIWCVSDLLEQASNECDKFV